jgi:hypothetical protein
MKNMKQQWLQIAGGAGAAALAALAIYSATGQPAPVLSIAPGISNTVVISVTNGTANSQYQLYRNEFLLDNASWVFITNGSLGQTQFVVSMGDATRSFFLATSSTNFVPPVVTLTIESPTNGTLVY